MKFTTIATAALALLGGAAGHITPNSNAGNQLRLRGQSVDGRSLTSSHHDPLSDDLLNPEFGGGTIPGLPKISDFTAAEIEGADYASNDEPTEPYDSAHDDSTVNSGITLPKLNASSPQSQSPAKTELPVTNLTNNPSHATSPKLSTKELAEQQSNDEFDEKLALESTKMPDGFAVVRQSDTPETMTVAAAAKKAAAEDFDNRLASLEVPAEPSPAVCTKTYSIFSTERDSDGNIVHPEREIKIEEPCSKSPKQLRVPAPEQPTPPHVAFVPQTGSPIPKDHQGINGFENIILARKPKEQPLSTEGFVRQLKMLNPQEINQVVAHFKNSISKSGAQERLTHPADKLLIQLTTTLNALHASTDEYEQRQLTIQLAECFQKLNEQAHTNPNQTMSIFMSHISYTVEEHRKNPSSAFSNLRQLTAEYFHQKTPTALRNMMFAISGTGLAALLAMSPKGRKTLFGLNKMVIRLTQVAQAKSPQGSQSNQGDVESGKTTNATLTRVPKSGDLGNLLQRAMSAGTPVETAKPAAGKHQPSKSV